MYVFTSRSARQVCFKIISNLCDIEVSHFFVSRAKTHTQYTLRIRAMPKLFIRRGYDLFEVASALQKAIRRSDVRLAGYWGLELFESRYREYMWKRLLTVSAEDCWGVITHEIKALYDCWKMKDAKKRGEGRVFASKAIILLCMVSKCRDADHCNFGYDHDLLLEDELVLTDEIEETRRDLLAVPKYAKDCHTRAGKWAGKTKRDFFIEEFEALSPREPGLFDDIPDKV